MREAGCPIWSGMTSQGGGDECASHPQEYLAVAPVGKLDARSIRARQFRAVVIWELDSKKDVVEASVVEQVGEVCLGLIRIIDI